MLINVPSSFKRPDGKWEHHIRQSDLGNFQHCPELHRRSLCGDLRGDEGDAALVGSACHESYAHATRTLLEGNEPVAADLLGVAHDFLANGWLEAVELGVFRQMQIATIDEARNLIDGYLVLWVQNILPMLMANIELIDSVEYQFDIKVYEDNDRVIYLTGTWDLGFSGELFDYKHSNSDRYSKQKAWQLSRYHAQPTHYAWAHDMVALKDSNEKTLDFDNKLELEPFTFININNKHGVQFIGPAEGVKIRTVGDCRFHLEVMKSLCLLIEAELPVWPLGATDWWCSSKWCPAWKDCRGKFIGDDPWGLLEKVEITLDKRR
jgi:hypothetical protein